MTILLNGIRQYELVFLLNDISVVQGFHECLVESVHAKLGKRVFTFHVDKKCMIIQLFFHQNQQVTIYYLALLLSIYFTPKVITEYKLVGMHHC